MSYVLITAAKNEQDYIEKTLDAVVKQTIHPIAWVIVSDGSTDLTEEIVQRYAEKYSFVKLVTRLEGKERDFGSKVRSMMLAWEHLKDLDFNCIGNIDADISLPENYYESMMLRFDKNLKLGITGGIRFDYDGEKFIPVQCAKNSVGGPFQFFRRACFEDVGGYIPIRYGGEDSIIEITARMKGWDVESVADFHVCHYRMTSSRTASNRIVQKWREGLRVYLVGYHPLFFTVKGLKMILKPRGFINIFILLGFYSGFIRLVKRPVTPAFIRYLRKENLSRLKAILKSGSDPLSHQFD